MQTLKNFTNFKGKKVSVLGASKMGIAAAKLLHSLGANVFISEIRKDPSMINELNSLLLRYESGLHSSSILKSELIIKSPGISPDHPVLNKAKTLNIPVLGEIDFALSFFPDSTKFIGITGSSGKTTTCLLLSHLLKSNGVDVQLSGHRNTPLSEILVSGLKPGYIIQEVSVSDLRDNKIIRPDIGVLLNIYPDHLNLFPNMDQYAWIKFSLLRNMEEKSVKLVSKSIKEKYINECLKFRYLDCFDKHSLSEITLPHYFSCIKENVMAAYEVSQNFNVSLADFEKALNTFNPPSHRRETFKTEYKNLTVINDAKCTNPASLQTALKWLDRPAILITGGRNKQCDFFFLKDDLKNKTKHLISFSETGKSLNVLCDENNIPYTDGTSMKLHQAIFRAFEIADSGDTILFSPGASCDLSFFKSAEESGECFIKQIKLIAAKTAKENNQHSFTNCLCLNDT